MSHKHRIEAHRDAIYAEVEAMVLPILRANAKRFARQLGMDYPEALQEARIALMSGLQHYDYNDSKGGIYSFVKVVVRRHFLKLWAEYSTQRRRPHVQVVTDDGKRVSLPVPFVTGVFKSEHRWTDDPSRLVDFLDTFESTLSPPDSEIMTSESDTMANTFRAALEAELSERDRQVFRCKVDPPLGLRLLMLDELAIEPTIPLIGRHLGLSKNEIDWALRRIRDSALGIIARDFSDLTDFSVVQAYVERRL